MTCFPVMRTAAVTNQFGKYYRDGLYDNCPERFRRWHNCLRMKLSNNEEALAIEESEWRNSVSGEHIFLFKPQYAAEAHKRYGVSTPR